MIIVWISGRFDEDGSFIGQYVTVSKNKQRISNELTAAAASAPSGATYVWKIISDMQKKIFQITKSEMVHY